MPKYESVSAHVALRVPRRPNIVAISQWIAIVLTLGPLATPGRGSPQTVSGRPFTLVGIESPSYRAVQLFGLTSDMLGRVYIGNNSNDTTGIPVQMFDPAVFASGGNVPIILQPFGPSVGDADGIAYYKDASNNEYIYVADRNKGVQRLSIPSGMADLLIPKDAINPVGSPIVVRPSDGHILVGSGDDTKTGDPRPVNEYRSDGTSVGTIAITTEQETMTLDPTTGTLYYAPFGTYVQRLSLASGTETTIGPATGFIDGGLAFDPTANVLFVGTANQANPGRVETLASPNWVTYPFANGFTGSLGILREPVSGDLYFLEDTLLYRLESAQVDSELPQEVLGKDVFNTTNQTVDGFEITLQGAVTIIAHDDGTPPMTFSVVSSGGNTVLRWTGPPTIPPGGKFHFAYSTPKVGATIISANWTKQGVVVACASQVAPKPKSLVARPNLLYLTAPVNDWCNQAQYLGLGAIDFKISAKNKWVPIGGSDLPLRTDLLPGGPFRITASESLVIAIQRPPANAGYALIHFVVGDSPNLDEARVTTDSLLLPLPADGVAPSAERVLILTDHSGPNLNGDSHLSDLIAAFASTHADVTTNSTELTNGVAMSPSLVAGYDVVIVATVTGQPIDAADIPVLESAVASQASGAFMFFTDACDGCTRNSATEVLSILNAAGGWSATLGQADNSSYSATLSGSYDAPFTGLPTVMSAAYSPVLGVPAANVLYSTNAPVSPGPCAVMAPGTQSTACVFLSTDVTQFWVTGGFSAAQANGLAAAYLLAALNCSSGQGTTAVADVVTTTAFGITWFAPNPAVREATLRFRLPFSDSPKLDIMDVAGRRVFGVALGLQRPGENQYRLPLSKLHAGVYFVRLVSRAGIATRRFVIIR